MPLGVSFDNPILTEQEAWDLAAFVNSKPRPHKNQENDWIDNDWIDIARKPIDFPYAPYADSFSMKQHKYGPFQPVAFARKTSK